MAKVTGPLMSFSASGRLARSMIFLDTKQGGVVKAYAEPRKKATAEQKSRRDAFRLIGKAYRLLHPHDLAAWSRAARKTTMTGYNAFVDAYFEAASSTAPALAYDVRLAATDATGYTVTAKVTADCRLSLSWGTDAKKLASQTLETAPANSSASFRIATQLPPAGLFFRITSTPASSNRVATGTYLLAELPEADRTVYGWADETLIAWDDGRLMEV